jgi:hypothetical protein
MENSEGSNPTSLKTKCKWQTKQEKASKILRLRLLPHLTSVNVWGSCCRGMCLFLQPVSDTCACTEGLGGSQRVGGQAQSILSLWEEEINTKASLPSHRYLTLCVSQLTLLVCCVVYPQSSYMYSMMVEFIK